MLCRVQDSSLSSRWTPKVCTTPFKAAVRILSWTVDALRVENQSS